MENITIVNQRDTELEFDINIQGANKKEPIVRFVIEGKPTNFGFQCRQGDEDKWLVDVPAISQLKDKAYPFRLEVIVDGYYFEPFRGTVDIVAEPDVKNNTVKQPAEPIVKAASVKKKEKKKPAKKKVEEQVELEEVIEDIIPEVVEVVEEVTPVIEETDDAIEEIVFDVEEEIVEEETDDVDAGGFRTMAQMWLNRNEEVDNKLTIPKMKLNNDSYDITEKYKNADEEVEELSEKAIKVRAILNSIKD